MNFQELGLVLKQGRESKGLTIEMAMESTKISRTNIVAMEEGNRSALPHPVYAKGFVKSYARFLGLDVEELCMVVDREYQDDPEYVADQGYDVAPAVEKTLQEKEAPVQKGKSVIPMLLVAVLLIAVVVLLLMNFNSFQAAQTQQPPVVKQDTPDESPSFPEILPEASSEIAPEADTSSASPADDVSSANETDAIEDADQQKSSGEATEESAEEAKAVEQTPVADKKVAEETVAKPAVVPAAETKPVVEKQKYDHIVVIRATTDKGCWIGVWRGKETKMARDFVLKQGEPLRLMFNSPRRIRIGNVAGVTVTYNGKPYAMTDAKGNIQTLRFGKN